MMKILTRNSSPICPLQRYYSTSVALYESCNMTRGAPQGNEIRASEDPWAILTSFALGIRHQQAKFRNFMKMTNVQQRNANYLGINRTSRLQNRDRDILKYFWILAPFRSMDRRYAEHPNPDTYVDPK